MINFIKTEVNKNRSEKWENIIFNGNQKYKKNYTTFLSNIKTIVTSSYAIGELQGLVTSKLGLIRASKSIFWKNSAEFLSFKNLDEPLSKMLDTTSISVNSKFVFDIGFIDTGFIEFAKSSRLPIITNDARTLGVSGRQYFGIAIYIPKENLFIKTINFLPYSCYTVPLHSFMKLSNNIIKKLSKLNSIANLENSILVV